MLIISDKLSSRLCYFPKNFTKNYERLELEIRNSGGEIHRFNVYEEIPYNDYFSFDLNFSDYPDGEYKATLYGDDEIISYQLIQIGDYKLENTNYNAKKPIKEYHS